MYIKNLSNVPSLSYKVAVIGQELKLNWTPEVAGDTSGRLTSTLGILIQL